MFDINQPYPISGYTLIGGLAIVLQGICFTIILLKRLSRRIK